MVVQILSKKNVYDKIIWDCPWGRVVAVDYGPSSLFSRFLLRYFLASIFQAWVLFTKTTDFITRALFYFSRLSKSIESGEQ